MIYNDLPPNYKYCMECLAFTPHTEDDSDSVCDVCTEVIHSYDFYCMNCGYVFSEDDINGPEYYYETIHNDGCHFGIPCVHDSYIIHIFDPEESNCDHILIEFVSGLSFDDRTKLHSQIMTAKETRCNCKRIKVYFANNKVSVRSWAGHGMDCSNHMEWETTMRCPICGEENVFEDGNC